MRLLATLTAAGGLLVSPALGATCQFTQTDQIPFDVRKAGDDGLTNRLADEVVKAFIGDCPESFVLSDHGGYAALVITLDSNVTWAKRGRRTRIFYSVSYWAQGDRRSHSKGSCWEDEMAQCARQIRNAAPQVSMA